MTDADLAAVALRARRSDVTRFCWCQQEVVLVPAAVIRAGRTGSCGAPRCEEAAS